MSDSLFHSFDISEDFTSNSYISLKRHAYRYTLLATGDEYFVLVAWIRYLCVAGMDLCIFANIKCLCKVMWENFLAQSKYAEFSIGMNSCTAQPGYWQNHVSYILSINAPLLLCDDSSVATIVLDAKYVISPFNSSFDFFMILCWFYPIHIGKCNIYCKKSMQNI